MCFNAQQLNTLNTIIMQLMSQVNNKKKVVNILNDVQNQFFFFEYFTLEKNNHFVFKHLVDFPTNTENVTPI